MKGREEGRKEERKEWRKKGRWLSNGKKILGR